MARYAWITSFHIDYYLGVDGISMALVLLTTVLCFLAMIASWKIDKFVRGYCILFLMLETGMLGTFLALDFFLFYIFWEVMLLPMYFLIGVWGGPRREYAAIKFFLYTLLGSVFILIALLAFYFTNVRDFVTAAAAGSRGRQAGRPGFDAAKQDVDKAWPMSRRPTRLRRGERAGRRQGEAGRSGRRWQTRSRSDDGRRQGEAAADKAARQGSKRRWTRERRRTRPKRDAGER